MSKNHRGTFAWVAKTDHKKSSVCYFRSILTIPPDTTLDVAQQCSPVQGKAHIIIFSFRWRESSPGFSKTDNFMALVANDRSCKVNGLNSCKTGTKKERILSKTAGCKINMQPKEAEFTIEGLPKAFLQSLRTLFDILDDGTRGYVHISEIESRWQGAETQGLPAGVLECLRRVTPSHGCLTFERFVAGLRNSMLNPENGNINLQPSTQSSYSTGPKSQSQINTHKTGASMGSRSYESKVRPLGPSNMTNMHHNRASSLQSRQRYPEDIYTTSSKQGEQTHFTSAPAAQRYGTTGYERTGRSLERIPVVPESGTYRTESVRVGKKAHHQNRMRSIESLALESPQLQTQGKFAIQKLSRACIWYATLKWLRWVKKIYSYNNVTL